MHVLQVARKRRKVFGALLHHQIQFLIARVESRRLSLPPADAPSQQGPGTNQKGDPQQGRQTDQYPGKADPALPSFGRGCA